MSEYTRNSSDRTNDVMERLTRARLTRGYSRGDMAREIEATYGYRITEDQYRACEQGLTRKVPLDVIIFAALTLDVDHEYLFGGIL